MDKQVRLGIIGLGGMGTSHAKSILEGKVPAMTLTAIADIDEARLVWARENLPDTIALFPTADELLQSGTCDAVIIAVPHYEHPPLAIAAMKQNLHVMCEKPPASIPVRSAR